MGISQALLSHYEKGIRGCSLEFVLKVADYYDVSCDYLLGRTAQRNGATISLNEIPDDQDGEDRPVSISALLPTLNKKLLTNSLNIIYSILENVGNKGLTNEVSAYLMLSVYKVYRSIYSANDKNPDSFFAIPEHLCKYLIDSSQNIAEGSINAILNGQKLHKNEIPVSEEKLPVLSPDELSKNYPKSAAGLYNLVQNVENKIVTMPE